MFAFFVLLSGAFFGIVKLVLGTTCFFYACKSAAKGFENDKRMDNLYEENKKLRDENKKLRYKIENTEATRYRELRDKTNKQS